MVELPRLPDGVGPGSTVTLGFRATDAMVFPAA